MQNTPFQYHNNKLGVKMSFLISDRNSCDDSLKLIKYDTLNKRITRETSLETELRRGCFNTDALVLFSSLPTEWRDKLTVAFGNPIEQLKKSWFQDHYAADRSAFDFYMKYRYGDDSRKLDLEFIEQYTYNASLLNTVLAIKESRKAYVKALGGIKVDLWQSLSNDVNEFRDVNHSLPSKKGSLRHKAARYAKEGYASLISGKLANSNSKKVTTKEQYALIDELIAKHTNLDNKIISDIYNTVAKTMGNKTITPQTIANRKKKTKLITYAGRNGTKALANNMLMQHKRKAPSNPMLYWTMDGWDSELMYQDTAVDKNGYTKTTYHNRFTIVVVLDPFNKYPVGYAIGTHETPELIKQALQNAIQHVYELFGKFYRPYQLQSDNYAKKKMNPIYNACTPNYTPAEVGNAKSKVIEPYFKVLNKYCQLMDNWSGYNMVSGSKNQPNSEVLDKIKKNFPDAAGCINQLESIIAQERSKKVEEYVANFKNVATEYRSEMDFETTLLLYGSTTGKTNKLRGDGITITIGGKKHWYDSFDVEFRNHTELDWIINYSKTDLTRVVATSTNGKQQFVLEEKHLQPMALADRKEGDAEALKRVNDYNDQVTDMIIGERKENAAILSEYLEKPELKDTLAKHLLTDSAGQHKDNRNEKRALAQKAKTIDLEQLNKQVASNKKTFEQEQEEYYNKKTNINDYI